MRAWHRLRNHGRFIAIRSAKLSFTGSGLVIYFLEQELPIATRSHSTNALLALPNTMPHVKHWDSQKALALHFLLVEVRREETVPIGRYDGFYWGHAFRGGLKLYCYGVFMDFSSCLRRSLMDKETGTAVNVWLPLFL